MRNVYKVLAWQYDPLGFIAPYTTRAKLIVQSMWDKQRDWDNPLIPHDLQRAWKEWESELHMLPRISLPRSYAPPHTDQMVISRQVHVFSDASEKAYGSVSYLRTEDDQGRVYLAFMAARSRVAPRRQHSIPRLELCGALTAAQLAKTIERELTVKIDQTILWSNSTTVLTWLQSESDRGAADRDKILIAADYQVECFPEEIWLLKAGKAVLRTWPWRGNQTGWGKTSARWRVRPHIQVPYCFRPLASSNKTLHPGLWCSSLSPRPWASIRRDASDLLDPSEKRSYSESATPMCRVPKMEI